MSLHTRYRPSAHHAGPSDHRAPVHSRWIGALGWRNPSQACSIVRTSGSVKYVVGAPRELKSRGGMVIVLGGAAAPPWAVCALAIRVASIAAPMATPAPIILRRDVESTVSASNESSV